MNSKIHAGIIGFGMAGRNMHYKALIEGLSDMVEVVAVCDKAVFPREGRDPGDYPLADSVAVYNDIEAFFAHPGLDSVHITTPSGQHLEIIEHAASSGKNIICDKPLDVTLARIDRAIALCKDSGVMLSVNFQLRLHPHLALLKKVISEGKLGDIVEGCTEIKLYRQPEYYTESSWHGRFDFDGGAALMNQGIHYIDLLQWLMGSPVTGVRKGVTERLVHTYIEAEDFGYGELELESGAAMTIMGGTCFRPGFSQELEVKGADGWAKVENGVITRAFWNGKDHIDDFGERKAVFGSVSSPVVGLENHVRCFRAAYEAFQKGSGVPVDGPEARKSTEIILGIYRASETGQEVRFPFDPGYKPSGIQKKSI